MANGVSKAHALCFLWGMYEGRTVFSQVTDRVHPELFRRCVSRYRGDYKVRKFSCWDQFLAMAFGQLTYRGSLRDIEACLRSRQPQQYHMGFRSQVARSTLAEANEGRDWRIYADLAQDLIRKARRLYAGEDLGLELEETVYAFDSTTIDLCLSLFPWALFRRRKAAIKVHTLLDLRGAIPTFIEITEGRRHDVAILDSLLFEAGAFYVMDRGYVDFRRLYALKQASAYFVIPAKRNLRFVRHLSRAKPPGSGIRSDQIGRLDGRRSRKDYPEKLRRIGYFDSKDRRFFVFLTNHLTLPATTICQLYKYRWQVELFFKWIKQHLRVKTFYGTSDNAVKTQIWIAISVYVLIAILKKELKIPQSLHTILQVLSVSAFEKVPIYQLFTRNTLPESSNVSVNQLKLWDF